uniref:Uncharacterized protein n=1 Tax=Eutreptiella gymnastica TaxID=73025 RepID=A0A7S4FUX9_9EUGL
MHRNWTFALFFADHPSEGALNVVSGFFAEETLTEQHKKHMPIQNAGAQRNAENLEEKSTAMTPLRTKVCCIPHTEPQLALTKASPSHEVLGTSLHSEWTLMILRSKLPCSAFFFCYFFQQQARAE